MTEVDRAGVVAGGRPPCIAYVNAKRMDSELLQAHCFAVALRAVTLGALPTSMPSRWRRGRRTRSAVAKGTSDLWIGPELLRKPAGDMI